MTNSYDPTRGNSYDRRARRVWMISPAAGFGGDGVTVPCWECGTPVTLATLCIDRIEKGGSYRRDKIRPHCRGCSNQEGLTTIAANRASRSHWHDRDGVYQGPLATNTSFPPADWPVAEGW